MVPERTRKFSTEEQLQDLFRKVDTDRSGDISMDEYFFWMLSTTTRRHGGGLEKFFKAYDKGGEGKLDGAEFVMAAEDVGFGSMAHEIFLEVSGKTPWTPTDRSMAIRHGSLAVHAPTP